MKRALLHVTVLGILSISMGPAVDAEESRTLRGEYVWDLGGSSGDLEATFTETAKEKWNVTFNFKFRGDSHTYTGTARGNLADGELSGRVQNENRARIFTFEGKFKNGRFRGTHAELKRGREQRTGTLKLGS